MGHDVSLLPGNISRNQSWKSKMLKKITFDNFRSFKNRVTVELTKTNYNILSYNAADNGVLKGCIFVGANGSGKSTIIRGIKLLLDLLFSEKILDLGSFLCVFGERRHYSVEYEFIIENEVIRYSFEVDTEKELISEKLYLNDRMLLDRMGFSAKSYIADPNGVDYRSEVSKDTLFLRTLYFNTKFASNPVLSAWMDFLKGSAYINMHERQIIHYGKTDMSVARYFDNGFRETVNRFFDDHGFGQSIVINRDTQDGTPFSTGDTDIENMILVKHKEIKLPILFAQESVGNQNLLRILPAFLTVIHNGGMLLIDDFSGAFHNDIESLLVRYFMEKSNHSQLLFVSHSTNLLSNSILRPDQEYSVEFRNEEGSSVKRFSSEQPRSAQNIEKMYLSGVFGGLPDYGYIW